MWLELVDANNIKHLVNLNGIIDIQYLEETNLTMITFSRSAFPSIYIRGNVMTEIKKIMQSDIIDVRRVTGEQK